MCPPQDLAGFTQCHFFAGVGVWSLALRRAGWPDSRPVWTGSCPCQPFSTAGKGNGFADERHLWPAWFHLIGQRNPDVVFGEQVSSKDADTWVDLVQTDMEALGYAFGAVPFPSAGVGAPHIRDRLYWLADSASNRRVGDGKGPTIQTGRNSGPKQSGFMAGGFEGRPVFSISEAPGMAIRPVADSANQRFNGRRAGRPSYGGDSPRVEPERLCDADRLDNADDAGLEGFGSGHKTEGGREQRGTESGRGSIAAGCPPSRLADTLDSTGHGSQPRGFVRELPQGVGALQTECRPTGPVNGLWSNADWLLCRDGKWRPVEPGTFPLANGAPARVGRLRAYGNAINAEAAEAVVRAYMECRP